MKKFILTLVLLLAVVSAPAFAWFNGNANFRAERFRNRVQRFSNRVYYNQPIVERVIIREPIVEKVIVREPVRRQRIILQEVINDPYCNDGVEQFRIRRGY